MSRSLTAIRKLALGAVCGVAGLVGAADSFTLDFSADAAGGRAVLGGLGHHGETWSWHLDSAHSVAPALVVERGEGQFEADDLSFGGGWTREAWSVAIDYDMWTDSGGSDSRLFSAAVAWQGDRWRVAFEPRTGRVTTSLPAAASLDIERKGFDRTALGAAIEWRDERWSWWAAAADWNYDPSLSGSGGRLARELQSLVDLRVLATLIRRGQTALADQYLLNSGATALRTVLQTEGLTGLARVVRYQVRRVQYAASLHSFALGLSDSTSRFGVERAFDAGALSLEYQRLAIPVDALQADSLALRWRWPLTKALDLTLSAGWMDAENLGTSTYAGLTFQWYID